MTLAKTSFIIPGHDDENHDQSVMNEGRKLIEMMRYQRPSKNWKEGSYAVFLDKFIKPVFGEPIDEYGNFVLKVGEKPNVMWTAHHDTVHRKNEYIKSNAPNDTMIYYLTQPYEPPKVKTYSNYTSFETMCKKARGVLLTHQPPKGVEKMIKMKVKTIETFMDENTEEVIEVKESFTTRTVPNPAAAVPNCLGADCTVGIFIMLHMIKNGVPGYYCIFADEEVGRIGSEGMAKDIEKHDFLNEVDFCVSFDRYGYEDIIVKQSGQRTASDEFGRWLGDQIGEFVSEHDYPVPAPSNNGSFTDSFSFRDIIPECTNICVGYKYQHQEREVQDIKYALILADAMCDIGLRLGDEAPCMRFSNELAEEKEKDKSASTAADVKKSDTSTHHIGHNSSSKNAPYGTYGNSYYDSSYWARDFLDDQDEENYWNEKFNLSTSKDSNSNKDDKKVVNLTPKKTGTALITLDDEYDDEDIDDSADYRNVSSMIVDILRKEIDPVKDRDEIIEHLINEMTASTSGTVLLAEILIRMNFDLDEFAETFIEVVSEETV